eukprot:6928987-Pyramimonas_sp.AAC.1
MRIRGPATRPLTLAMFHQTPLGIHNARLSFKLFGPDLILSLQISAHRSSSSLVEEPSVT